MTLMIMLIISSINEEHQSLLETRIMKEPQSFIHIRDLQALFAKARGSFGQYRLGGVGSRQRDVDGSPAGAGKVISR